MGNNLNERKQRLYRVNNVMFWVTLVSGIAYVVWLIIVGQRSTVEVVFRGFQFVTMLLVLSFPVFVRRRLKRDLPIELYVLLILFCFASLVLGGGLDFYGRFPWLDTVLHFFSGLLLSMLALWFMHVIMGKDEKYIYQNKYFLCLFVVMFSLGVGALWELTEYVIDIILGTNLQQFILRKTGAIITPEDIPLCGQEALADTMKDLVIDLGSSLLVAVYVFIRHDKVLARYQATDSVNG